MPAVELDAVALLNHLSFLLLFAGTAAKSRQTLHLWSAISLSLGIAFMYLNGVGNSVFWLSILLGQNLFQWVRHQRRHAGEVGVRREPDQPTLG